MAVTYQTSGVGGVNVIWNAWTSNTTGSTMQAYNPWTCWNSANTATTTNAATVWIEWNQGTGEVTRRTTYRYQAPTPTAEQLAEQERRNEEYRKRQAEEQKIRIAAEKLAEKLLREHLDKRQRREYKRSKHFHVVSPSGKRYRIERRRSGNVVELKEGKGVNRFCIHPIEDVPDPDTMLAQKLLLETDEAAFVRIANRTPIAV